MRTGRGQVYPALAGLILLALAVTTSWAQTKPAAPPAGRSTPAAATQNPLSKDSTSPSSPTIRHGSPITALAFSSDGKKLAVGCYGQVSLFDTATWQICGQFKQVIESVRTLAFQPGGTLLAIGSGLPGRSGITTLWDISDGQKPYTYSQQYDTIESIAFDKNGKQLLIGADDNKAHLFTTLTSNLGTSIDAHNGRVTAVAFSPKAQTLYVTGGMDKIVKVWVEKTGQNVCNFDQCESGITGLVFLNNGTQFVGSGQDGKLYWWGVGHDERKDTYGGYFFRQFEAHPGGVNCLSGSANGQKIITGGEDKVVCIWNPDNGQKLHSFTDSQGVIYAAALSPAAKSAAAGGRDGLVLIWDVDSNKLANTLVPPVLAPQSTTVKPSTRTASSSTGPGHRP